ncbi:MAG: 16S rRNA (uracil(1498)-N(3))-methyltransferase [Alphaproteobacteria bacterium]|nr:16S rRNA (uracil(1498)-N(3))-methyltransferase [Alphaproteobacteria bacterium]
MRRFPAPTLPGDGQLLILDEAASHHLLRVTGVAPGQAVELFDGSGGRATAVLESSDGQGRARLRQTSPTVVDRRPERWLVLGLPKHAAMDTVVRMATELGVTCIQPVLAARSVAKGHRADRWLRIAESAAAQCGRSDLPELAPICSLADALDRVPARWDRRVLAPCGPAVAAISAPCAVLIGPEGGLTAAEVQQAVAAGFQPEGWGDTVLRVDTAVAVALGRSL